MSGTSDRARFDGDDLIAMFCASMQLLGRHASVADALNVFPVPDGDTGKNMYLTLQETMRATDGLKGAPVGQVASVMAKEAMMQARGNSGIILSQFFKGLAIGLDGRADFGPTELATALESARGHAYAALGKPVEGTMLTVISRVADAATAGAAAGQSLAEMADAVCDAAREAVELTPTMLPVLREAGVVDAGGYGLWVILEGVRCYLDGEDVESLTLEPPEAVGVEAPVGTVATDFLDATEEDLYGYCTQLLIEGEDLQVDAVRNDLTSMAMSTVVVGDETMVKVHVHAVDPGPVISYAVSMGTLSQVKIENMDEQHRDYALARRREAFVGQDEAVELPMAVAAVAPGEGLEAVFADLGAARVLRAGDTMNPSVREILDVVEGAPSDNVIFLPNNPNIVPAAAQAAELSQKTLRVVPSKTIPQGIAAMMAFNLEKDFDENVSGMGEMLPSVRTGEVCRAVRPAQLDGIPVREGQVIGLLERQLVATGEEPNEVLLSLLQAAEVSKGDVVTLYWGGELTEAEAEAAAARVNADFPGAEAEVYVGGQPHYHYIVSIE